MWYENLQLWVYKLQYTLSYDIINISEKKLHDTKPEWQAANLISVMSLLLAIARQMCSSEKKVNYEKCSSLLKKSILCDGGK